MMVLLSILSYILINGELLNWLGHEKVWFSDTTACEQVPSQGNKAV